MRSWTSSAGPTACNWTPYRPEVHGIGAVHPSRRRTALGQMVLAALAGLAPRQRAVVVLRHWLDLDVAETARILSCSTGR